MDPRLAVLELRSVRGTGGGPEKTILLGTERTNRARFAVTVCYIRDARDEVFKIDHRARHVDIDYVEVHERHSFDRRIWHALTELVRNRRIDIVHSHEYKTDFLALLLAWRRGVIPLATVHGWTGQTAREKYFYYPIGKRLLTAFPRVVAVSSDIRDELVRHGTSPERITVLLNGIDATAFRRVPARRVNVRQELGYAPDLFVIAAVGRLERQKRFDLLLEAFAPLARSRPELRLAVVGDGSLREELTRTAARLGMTDRCRFLGHRDDAGDLHHAFDLFVQSSEYEGTPNAVLEAMAMETPVVATDAGGTQDLLRPDVDAIVVPTHNVPALQAAMAAAIADPSAARDRALSARRRVETDLSFDARTRQLEAIYEALAGGRRVAGPIGGVPSHA